MYILLDTCQNPMILRIIYFASLLLDIAFVLIPIGLIVMMMVDFSKVVISGDEKDIKNTKLIGKRVIYAIVVFCIPWIVNVLMDFLDGIGLSVSYRTCITNAKSGNFDYINEEFIMSNPISVLKRTVKFKEKPFGLNFKYNIIESENIEMN